MTSPKHADAVVAGPRMPLAEAAGNAAARGNAIGAKIPRPRSASSQSLVYRCVQPCDVRAKPGKGGRVGALEAGQEVAVAEIAKDGRHLRIGALGGWVPTRRMALAVGASLEGGDKENDAPPRQSPPTKRLRRAAPLEVTPRPTADGTLQAGAKRSASPTPTLFDDCGRPSGHPQFGDAAPPPAGRGQAQADAEVEVRFEQRGSLGIAFTLQGGRIVVREVVPGGAADALREAGGGLRPGMVLRAVQGQAVATLGFTKSMELLSTAPRPLCLEFERGLVTPATPTKASGRSAAAAADAFFVSGMHQKKGAALVMAKMAREYIAEAAKLLLNASTAEEIRQVELHLVSALRLAPANGAAFTLLAEAERALSLLTDDRPAGIPQPTEQVDVIEQLAEMIAPTPPRESGSSSAEEECTIAELLAQLQALDADESATDASVPMQQLLTDLELLELEDELQEMQGEPGLALDSAAKLDENLDVESLATPETVRPSSSAADQRTPQNPSPTAEEAAVPLDASDFTAMMASWRLSCSPGAPATTAPTATTPGVHLERDIAASGEGQDDAPSPELQKQAAACSSNTGSDGDSSVAVRCGSRVRAAKLYASPSDSSQSPVSAALGAGRHQAVMLTAQRRLRMRSQPDMVVESATTEADHHRERPDAKAPEAKPSALGGCALAAQSAKAYWDNGAPRGGDAVATGAATAAADACQTVARQRRKFFEELAARHAIRAVPAPVPRLASHKRTRILELLQERMLANEATV